MKGNELSYNKGSDALCQLFIQIFYMLKILVKLAVSRVETFTYEMVKKYKDLDIAVVYKTANPRQLQRIRKHCPTYQHTNEDIICKVAIINYDTSIIDYITKDIWRENAKEDEGIYQTVHADYENPAYTWRPPTDDRIKAYITITKHIDKSFKKVYTLFIMDNF